MIWDSILTLADSFNKNTILEIFEIKILKYKIFESFYSS